MEQARDGDLIDGGTVNDLLKMAKRMNEMNGQNGLLPVDGLIVDEASMMSFPDFLALATLVSTDGEMMLTGDHLQLAPITAHDWEKECREQVVRLSPHESAYMAISKLGRSCREGRSSARSCPPPIV